MSEPRVITSGRHLDFLEIDGWEYVQRRNCSGVVVIVALTTDDKMIFVEQHRPPVRCNVIELPAGLAGDIAGQEDERLVTAARRELVEETGYDAAEITQLTVGPPSAGLTDELITFVRARGLHKVGAGGGDQNEAIEVHEVELQRVEPWLATRREAGALIDAKVYAGLYFARCS